MRAFLNAILAFIDAASLSDEEFDSIDLEDQEYTSVVYDELLAVLDSRETVSNTRDRLRYYFLAKDVEISETEAAETNIYAGDVLCD